MDFDVSQYFLYICTFLSFFIFLASLFFLSFVLSFHSLYFSKSSFLVILFAFICLYLLSFYDYVYFPKPYIIQNYF